MSKQALIIGLVVLLLATAVVPALAAQPATTSGASFGATSWTVQSGHGFGVPFGPIQPYGDCEDDGNCDD